MQSTNRKKIFPIIATAVAIFLALIVYIFLKSNSVTMSSGKKFMNELKQGNVSEIYIKDNYVYASGKIGTIRVLKYAINLDDLYKNYPIKSYTKSSNTLITIAVLILLSILVILIVLLRRNQNSKVLSSTSVGNNELDNLTSDIKPQYNLDYNFKDIAGISDVKEDIEEIIDFLKNPLKFQKHNIRMPKGVLLVGPPGVGKTLIAKAISSEANVPFFYNSGASFVHIYAGAGAKRVKELFKKAKKLSPSIIFIDEIDAVGKSRDNLDSNEREATLNQLLVEIDGFNANSGVVVIGATNRVDVLDNALLRPGRFDRRVFIGLPNIKEREQVITHYLKDKNHNIDIKEVAKLTSGFSPATIETLINEAALYALKNNKNTITIEHIYSVKERVVYGKKRVVILSAKDREIKANYQASKAVVAKWLGFEFDKINLLTPINLSQDEEILSKNLLINKAKVSISSIIYLQKKYKDTFNISKDDKHTFEATINTILKDYSISQYDNYNLLSAQIKEETEELLERLDSAISAVASRLNEKEVVLYKDIEDELNDIL